jgi:hypothetical protein
MKRFLLLALAGVLAAGIALPALALGPLDVAAELPVYSKYVWRGMNSTNDWVLQPSATGGVLGISLGVWANMDLTDVNLEEGNFWEIDYTLSYGLGLPAIDLNTGFLFYVYPDQSQFNTSEFFLTGQVNVLLSPRLTVYQDIDKYKGAYWEASIGHGFKAGEAVQVDLTGGLGLGSGGFIRGYFAGQTSIPDNDLNATMNDLFLRAEAPFHPLPFFTIAPSVTYTSLLGDARKAVAGNSNLYSGKKTNVVFGLAARFSF